MGNLEERKGGTLWEKEDTLRIPCGDLVGTIPQGSGLLPQGTEGDGGDLVAISGNTYQEKEKISVLPEAEREKLLWDFRAYLEGEGRTAQRVSLYVGTLRVFLPWLTSRGFGCRLLGLAELESRLREMTPACEPSRNRRGAVRAFWAFLQGKHSGLRLLPPFPPSLEPLAVRLDSGLTGRGFCAGQKEALMRGFRHFCRFLALGVATPPKPVWEDVERYRKFLATEYLHMGRPLRMQEQKAGHAVRSLEILREDAVLRELPPRQGYEPSIARYPVPGLGHGYRVLLCAFRDYLEATGMSATSVRAYPRPVRKFLAWLEGMGVHDVREVDERMLHSYRSGPMRLAAEGGEAGVASRILAEMYLKKFFAFLYRTRRIHADPAAHMELTPSPRKLPRVMPEASEVDAMISAVDAGTHMGIRDLAVLELLYGTGLRSSELRGLSLGDIQLDGQLLSVHGKGGKDALVPMGEKVVRALELYLAFARPVLARRGAGKGGEIVFLNEYGRPLTVQSLGNLVHRRSKAVGIERNIVPHSFRHACATHMLRNGADLRVVQQLLRHESIDTTLVYTRMLTSDIRDAQRKFHPRERD
jgi:integrase/recombinase XerD